MSFSTPAEIVAQAERAALNKISLSFPRTLVAAMLAGIYIAMGGLLSLLIGYGFPEWTAGNPGLQKLLSGCMFPLGLILVVLAGAELFTGNNAVLIPGFMKKKYGIMPILKNWTIVYIGNFIGAIFFVYIMVWCTGIVDADPWKKRHRPNRTSQSKHVWVGCLPQRNRSELVSMPRCLAWIQCTLHRWKNDGALVSGHVFRRHRLRTQHS